MDFEVELVFVLKYYHWTSLSKRKSINIISVSYLSSTQI